MTRQQVWAKLAFEKVRAQKGKKDEEKFATYCMRGPTLIRQSGLLHTLAFLLRDANDQMAENYVQSMAEALEIKGGASALLARARDERELGRYVALARDAVHFAVWLRRFAQSELKTETV